MKFSKLSEKKWYNGAVIACIGVAFYVLLTNLNSVLTTVGAFLGSFKSVFLGIIFAYILNPLARFFYLKLFHKMKVGGTRWGLSVGLTIVTALLALVFLIGTLLPQLIESIMTFSENFDGYASSLIRLIEESFLRNIIDIENLQTLSKNAMASISGFVMKNSGKIHCKPLL